MRMRSRWLALGLMLWKDVLWMLVNIEFWAVAGMLFDLRQGKRLFGIAESGYISAVILGGFAIPALTRAFGTVEDALKNLMIAET